MRRLLALAAVAAAMSAEAAAWKPADAVAMQTLRGKDFKIVVYQYRVEFHAAKAAKPVVLTFRHPVTVSPSEEGWGKDSRGNILACTDRFLVYSITDPEEQKAAAGGDGVETQARWADPKAQFPDFCGVIGPDGTVVFRFPAESFPGRMYEPVGIAGDGRRAAVLVGRHGKLAEPEGEADEGLTVEEVWVWEHPAALRKRRATKRDREVFLLGELRKGRL